jgi:hypothetical protein
MTSEGNHRDVTKDQTLYISVKSKKLVWAFFEAGGAIPRQIGFVSTPVDAIFKILAIDTGVENLLYLIFSVFDCSIVITLLSLLAQLMSCFFVACCPLADGLCCHHLVERACASLYPTLLLLYNINSI